MLCPAQALLSRLPDTILLFGEDGSLAKSDSDRANLKRPVKGGSLNGQTLAQELR